MSKPYHLMTSAEKITARIAANRAIDEKVAQGPPGGRTVTDLSKLGHAFLDALPDMEKGTEAESLLKLGRIAKNRKR